MKTVKRLAKRAVAFARKLYRREPARVNAAVVSAVIAVAAYFDVVLDGLTAAQVVAYVLAVLLGGEVTRQRVRPLKR